MRPRPALLLCCKGHAAEVKGGAQPAAIRSLLMPRAAVTFESRRRAASFKLSGLLLLGHFNKDFFHHLIHRSENSVSSTVRMMLFISAGFSLFPTRLPAEHLLHSLKCLHVVGEKGPPSTGGVRGGAKITEELKAAGLQQHSCTYLWYRAPTQSVLICDP